jgi:hypothetical protein
MILTKWICVECKHYLRGNRCLAFLDGIPEEIYSGKDDHSKPLKFQENKIVFEPIE